MRDNILTKKLLGEIADIHRFTDDLTHEEYMANVMIQKAVVMSIINIGELSKAYSEAFLQTHSDIPWKQIQAMRNIAAHQYGAVDQIIVWDTIKHSIPTLEEKLKLRMD